MQVAHSNCYTTLNPVKVEMHNFRLVFLPGYSELPTSSGTFSKKTGICKKCNTISVVDNKGLLLISNYQLKDEAIIHTIIIISLRPLTPTSTLAKRT